MRSGIASALSEGGCFSSPKAGAVRVLVIHGPNLNLLGTREPQVYGSMTLGELDAAIGREAETLGVSVETVQFNAEGAIIDAIHAARGRVSAIVINPGAYTHYSYAIRDALAAVDLPAVEVHLTNVAAREPFREHSVITAACIGSVAGFGALSYCLALRALVARAERKPA
jgi:3-dehydroquinate dehydratase II